MNDLLQAIKDKIATLDKHTKDYRTTEDYASKCRFACNILQTIVSEYEGGK